MAIEAQIQGLKASAAKGPAGQRALDFHNFCKDKLEEFNKRLDPSGSPVTDQVEIMRLREKMRQEIIEEYIVTVILPGDDVVDAGKLLDNSLASVPDKTLDMGSTASTGFPFSTTYSKFRKTSGDFARFFKKLFNNLKSKFRSWIAFSPFVTSRIALHGGNPTAVVLGQGDSEFIATYAIKFEGPRTGGVTGVKLLEPDPMLPYKAGSDTGQLGPLVKYTTESVHVEGAGQAPMGSGAFGLGAALVQPKHPIHAHINLRNANVPGVSTGHFIRDGYAQYWPVIGEVLTANSNITRIDPSTLPFAGILGTATAASTLTLSNQETMFYRHLLDGSAPGFRWSIPRNRHVTYNDQIVITAGKILSGASAGQATLDVLRDRNILYAYFLLNHFTIGYFYGINSEDGFGAGSAFVARKLFSNSSDEERAGVTANIARGTGGIPVDVTGVEAINRGTGTISATFGSLVPFDVDLGIGIANLDGREDSLRKAGHLTRLKDRVIAKIFREQCFLIDHYAQLVPFSQRKKSARERVLEGEATRRLSTKKLTKVKNNGMTGTKKEIAKEYARAMGSYYPFFTAIDPNPARTANKISGIPGLKPLLQAETSDFSFLVPRIKIYKSVRKRDLQNFLGSVSPNSGLKSTLRSIIKMSKTPAFKRKGPEEFVDFEIPFRAAPTTRDINEMFTNNKSRPDGVGFRSFEFNFIGRNSFEVERNIECSMGLFFRNLEDLNSGSDAVKFIDLILFGVSKNKPQTNEFNQRVDYFNADHYRMRAVVGWEVPPEHMTNDLLKGKNGKNLRKLLKKNVLSLNLVLSNHKVNFAQDGSGTLEIEFMAAIESSHKDIARDLLKVRTKEFRNRHELIAREKRRINLTEKALSSNKERLEDAETALEEMREAGDTVVANIPTSTAMQAALYKAFGGNDENFKKRLETLSNPVKLKQEIADDEEALAAFRRHLSLLESNQRAEAYSAFIKRLYRQSMFYFDLPEGHRHLADSVIGMTSRRQMVKDPKYAAGMRMNIPRIKNLASLIKSLNKDEEDMKMIRSQILGGDTGNKIGALVAEVTKNDKVDGKDKYKYKEGELEDLAYLDNPSASSRREGKIDDGDRRMYFTYIGEVLMAGFTLFQDDFLNPPEENIRYLFGTVPFYDVVKDRPVIMNMVDIPISLNAVTAFWFNKVVRPARKSYKLNEFIRDVVNDLILPFFGPKCYPNYPSSLPRKPIVSLLEGRGAQGGERVPKRGRIYDINQIITNPGISFDDTSVEMYNYYYVYVGGTETFELSSDFSRDAERGLFHFFIGQDRGLLKSAEFSRLDQKFVREMRTVSKEDRVSAQLRQPYKVKINTFGNTLFRPGMYCYINPRVAGGSPRRKRSLTYKMNLGGYGLITKVNNFIEPGEFKTELEVILAGLPDPNKNISGKVIDMRAGVSSGKAKAAAVASTTTSASPVGGAGSAVMGAVVGGAAGVAGSTPAPTPSATPATKP